MDKCGYVVVVMDGCRQWKTVDLKVWKGGMPQTGNYFSDSPAKKCRLVCFFKEITGKTTCAVNPLYGLCGLPLALGCLFANISFLFYMVVLSFPFFVKK